MYEDTVYVYSSTYLPILIYFTPLQDLSTYLDAIHVNLYSHLSIFIELPSILSRQLYIIPLLPNSFSSSDSIFHVPICLFNSKFIYPQSIHLSSYSTVCCLAKVATRPFLYFFNSFVRSLIFRWVLS